MFTNNMATDKEVSYEDRNKFMHPRNIYRQHQDFKQLAIEYENIRPFVKISLSGQPSFDFKNPTALAELTKTLLLRDFNLNVQIPPNKLVPTLPLRLNYILWLEDILNSVDIDEIHGIDIGTGASCIYPLLAAKRGWKMLATEIDESSLKIAQENVSKNNLDGKITLRHVADSDLILNQVIDENVNYQFCMSNPPFFSISESPKNRSKRRRSPSNGPTGVKSELETNGGELAFIRKIIRDSIKLRDRVSIYTTMIGKKENFKSIREEVKNCGVLSFATTEFHQGRVTRWGIAWSFHVLIPQTNDNHCQVKPNMRDKPLSFFLQDWTTAEAIEKIKMLLSELQVAYDIETSEPFTCNVSAFEETWTNQRRKRREKKRRLESVENVNEKCNTLEIEEVDEKDGRTVCNVDNNNGQIMKTPKLEFLLKVFDNDGKIIIEVTLLSGIAGKNGLYQVSQFLKNNLKR